MIKTVFGTYEAGNSTAIKEERTSMGYTLQRPYGFGIPLRFERDGEIYIYNLGSSLIQRRQVRYSFCAHPDLDSRESHEHFVHLKKLPIYTKPQLDFSEPPILADNIGISVSAEGEFQTDKPAIVYEEESRGMFSPSILRRVTYVWFVDGERLEAVASNPSARRALVFAELKQFIHTITEDIEKDKKNIIEVLREAGTDGITNTRSYFQNYTDLVLRKDAAVPVTIKETDALHDFCQNAFLTHEELIEKAERAVKAFATRFIGTPAPGEIIDKPGIIAEHTRMNLPKEKRDRIVKRKVKDNDGNWKTIELTVVVNKRDENGEDAEETSQEIKDRREEALKHGKVQLSSYRKLVPAEDYDFAGKEDTDSDKSDEDKTEDKKEE